MLVSFSNTFILGYAFLFVNAAPHELCFLCLAENNAQNFIMTYHFDIYLVDNNFNTDGIDIVREDFMVYNCIISDVSVAASHTFGYILLTIIYQVSGVRR